MLGGTRRTSTARWRFPFAFLVGFLLVLSVGVAQAGANVYWTNPGFSEGHTIGRAAPDGTGVNQGFITTQGVPQGVASDGQYVFWSESGGAVGTVIGREKVDGTGFDESFVTGLNDSEQGATALAVDSHYVYFSAQDLHQIQRASLTDGTVDPTWVAHPTADGSGALGLAVDSQYVYWTESTYQGRGLIERASLAGPGAPTTLVDLGTGNLTVGIAVNGQHTYWTEWTESGRQIGRADLDGSNANSAFIDLGYNTRPQGMAIDSQHVYWADNWADTNNNPIMEANLDGSNVNPKFVTGADQPTAVAVDPAGATPAPPTPPAGTTSTPTTTPPLSPPQAFADPATATGPMTATLHGRVGPNGVATVYHFDYGTSTAYGHRVPAADASGGSGTSLTAVSANVTGLTPSTTYHYRVVATSAGGTARSVDEMFTTPAACRDRIGPISRFNRKLTVITRDGIHAVGTTTDRGGCRTNILDARDGGGVRKVMISFALQIRGRNIPLKPGLKWGKPVSVHVWTYNFAAKGKHDWTFNLKVKLQPGLYRVFAMGYDRRGNREPYDRHMRNGMLIWLR
jgi:hypothetical protein